MSGPDLKNNMGTVLLETNLGQQQSGTNSPQKTLPNGSIIRIQKSKY